MSIENATKIKDFTEQFEDKQSFELFGGKVEYVDITPENLKKETPVVFALGWGETAETFRDSIRKMVYLGRRVICIDHQRRGGKVEDNNSDNYPEEELRKALAILHILDNKGIEKVDVIAHSEGGINTAIAGSIDKEKFRNIIFVNVGGLIGKDKFPKLVGRFSLSVIQDFVKPWFNQEQIQTIFGSPGIDTHTRTKRTVTETLGYIAKNPLRALKEAIAISQAETDQMLKDLRKNGIGVVVINGENDPVFPMNKMEKVVKPMKEKGEIDDFRKVPGGHSEIFSNPEGFTPMLDNILDEMEKRGK